MLTLILLGVLVFGFLVGLKRGLIYQAIHLVGFIVSFIVARLFYDNLAPHLRLWIPYPGSDGHGAFSVLLHIGNLENAYYNGISFLILFISTKIVLHVLGSMLDFVANLPVLHFANRWLGGLVGFVEIYLIVFVLLYFAALIPVDTIQHALGQSTLAQDIIQHTPVFSEKVKQLWMENTKI